MTRNLSEDGSRVFFQTQEALVPQDKNGQTDVYEWEREGAGSCEHASASFSASNGGCLYLISTGESDKPSYFGDASANGSNVFFFTRQSLVGQDRDENYDIYDARIDGGIAAQNPAIGELQRRRMSRAGRFRAGVQTHRRVPRSRATATRTPTGSKPKTKSTT